MHGKAKIKMKVTAQQHSLDCCGDDGDIMRLRAIGDAEINNLSTATKREDGLMSKEDKEKLDSLIDETTFKSQLEDLKEKDSELNDKIDATKDEIPTSVSQLNNDSGYLTDYMQSVTYSELVELYDSNSLIPGRQYRITDYVSSSINSDALQLVSVNNKFDIIVTALTASRLSEDASACLHEGDAYFANCNLSAWKLKYTTDQSLIYDKYTLTGDKGIIYEMIDEYGNTSFFDFKGLVLKTGDGSGGFSESYLFYDDELDGSLNGIYYNVYVGPGENFRDFLSNGVVLKTKHNYSIGGKVNAINDIWVNYKNIHFGKDSAAAETSIAIGKESSANVGSVAIGDKSTTATNGVALGCGASANYDNAIAIGNGVIATQSGETVINNFKIDPNGNIYHDGKFYKLDGTQKFIRCCVRIASNTATMCSISSDMVFTIPARTKFYDQFGEIIDITSSININLQNNNYAGWYTLSLSNNKTLKIQNISSTVPKLVDDADDMLLFMFTLKGLTAYKFLSNPNIPFDCNIDPSVLASYTEMATKSYVDEQLEGINTLLENLIN